MMSDFSYKQPSNVQLNKGHKHTDDFITKKYILPMLDANYARNTKINLDKLEQYALEKTEECFQNRIS